MKNPCLALPLLSMFLLGALSASAQDGGLFVAVRNKIPRSTVYVNDSAQLAEAIQSLEAGDVVVLADGIYTNDVTISNVQASFDKPILIKAQNTGGTHWRGILFLDQCSFISVSGMAFDAALLDLPPSSWDDVRVHLKNSHHCRITRCALEFDESGLVRSDVRYWVFLEKGEYNELDHCRFGDKITIHAPLKIIHTEYAPIIRYNYFPIHSSAEGSNGYETLQLGYGPKGHKRVYMHALVEYNLFENCDGEAEIVSVKTSANTIRFNTFSGCRGKLVLRMSNDSSVYNNYFLNPSRKSGVGGIRIHGSHNAIYNNYFEGLTANTFETWAGDTDVDLGTEEIAYRQSKENRIVFNTAYDCQGYMFYFRETNSTYRLPSKDWKIRNNLFVVSGDGFVGGAGETGTLYDNNIVYATNGIPEMGGTFGTNEVWVVDPQLVRCADGLWRQQSSSPGIDRASPVSGLAHPNDMDWQPRDATPDIGADEYSDEPVLRLPLVPADVGPFAD